MYLKFSYILDNIYFRAFSGKGMSSNFASNSKRLGIRFQQFYKEKKKCIVLKNCIRSGILRKNLNSPRRQQPRNEEIKQCFFVIVFLCQIDGNVTIIHTCEFQIFIIAATLAFWVLYSDLKLSNGVTQRNPKFCVKRSCTD